LTLKGEKEEEREESTATSYHAERSYGSFHRVIPLPAAIRSSEAKATFKKGVLTVVLPKIEEEKAKGKKVEVKVE
jgi:HSP20 family protein